MTVTLGRVVPKVEGQFHWASGLFVVVIFKKWNIRVFGYMQKNQPLLGGDTNFLANNITPLFQPVAYQNHSQQQ
ncbi:MAG: hypothetical protein IPJ13_05185 [Saprospiraceae bacterium]|nr:hypothetical protein [Saprospiraceae bacterium]